MANMGDNNSDFRIRNKTSNDVFRYRLIYNYYKFINNININCTFVTLMLVSGVLTRLPSPTLGALDP